MIHVIATISTQPGQREPLLAAFRDLVPLVRAEDGCIEYGTAVDIPPPLPGQPAVRDEVVTVIEKWESLEALQMHLNAPHMLQHRENVKGLVLGVEIRVFDPR
jgi:quinol monooxygenase YgiN